MEKIRARSASTQAVVAVGLLLSLAPAVALANADAKSSVDAAASGGGRPQRAILSVKIMDSIARSVAGMAGPSGERRKEMLDETNRRLHEAYPELIVAPDKGEWIFNAVGGSLAEIKILFCSPTEYVALWGAPLDTDGFSGRYNSMDVWDIMLDGKMTSYPPGGRHQVTTFANSGPPGTEQTSLLHRGVGKHFRLEQGAYMIDYGRGNVVASLGSGAMLGHMYVTGDWYSMGKMLGSCAKQTFNNWLTPERRKAIARYRATNPDYDSAPAAEAPLR